MHRGNGGTNPHAFLIKGKHHDRAEFKQHYLKPTDNITAWLNCFLFHCGKWTDCFPQKKKKIKIKKNIYILYIVFICFAKKSKSEIKFNIRRRIAKYEVKNCKKNYITSKFWYKVAILRNKVKITSRRNWILSQILKYKVTILKILCEISNKTVR